MHHLTRSGAIVPTVVALVAVALICTATFHVGFQASDDASYLSGALGWLEHFPYVGDSHWTLRHTIVIPAALAIKFFGLNERAVSLIDVLYFIGFVAVNAWYLFRYLGAVAAVVSTALVIVLPGFVVVATYLNPDIAELFFVSLSFWLFVNARVEPERYFLWLASGLSLGLAFVTRPTAAATVLFFVLVFLVRPAAPRVRYLLLGIGLTAVVAADWTYLTAMTGDVAYRFNVDLNHDRVDRFAEAARVAATGGLLDKEGNVSVNVFLDPLLNLFISQKYVLLFWLLVPAVFHVWHERAKDGNDVRALACGLGVVSFLFIALNPKLYLVPRYFIISAWCASVVVGWWLGTLWMEQRRTLFAMLAAGYVLAGALALSVENTDPRFVERQLVAWVRDHPMQSIHVDPETALRSRYLFDFAGLSMNRVIVQPPPPGAVAFFSADRVAQCATLPRCKERAADFLPRRGWTELRVIDAAPRLVGRILRATGAERYVPGDVARKLLLPGARVVIYSVEEVK